MSYYMTQRDISFYIRKELVPEAFKAIKGIEPLQPGITRANSIREAFRYRYWQPEIDRDGNITELEFVGERLDDDYTFFEALAPFVEPGSFIEMSGEDGCVWRWHFHNGKCYDEDAMITYECPYEE